MRFPVHKSITLLCHISCTVCFPEICQTEVNHLELSWGSLRQHAGKIPLVSFLLQGATLRLSLGWARSLSCKAGSTC